jgi:hypothetical protein
MSARNPNTAEQQRAQLDSPANYETQMIDWALGTISEELMWALVVIVVIVAVAGVALLKK